MNGTREIVKRASPYLANSYLTEFGDHMWSPEPHQIPEDKATRCGQRKKEKEVK